MAATDPLYLDPPTDEDLAAALSAWREGRLQHELAPGSLWYRILRAQSADEALKFARVCYPSYCVTSATRGYAASRSTNPETVT
jgi:hypothetical protein